MKLKNLLIRRMTGFSIFARLTILSIVMSLLFVTVGGMSIGINYFMQKRYEAVTDAVELVREAQLNFKIQVQEWKNILIRGQRRKDYEKYRAVFLQRGDAVQKELEKLRSLEITDEQTRRDVSELQRRMKELNATYLKSLRKYQIGRMESINRVDRAVRGVDRKPTRMMDAIAREIKEKNTRALEDLYNQFTYVSITIMAGGVLAGIFTGVLISSSIILPIRSMKERVYDIASGDGDLTRRIDIISYDEIGDISGQLNGFFDQILKVVKRINDAGQKVTESSASISRAGEDLSATAEQFTQKSNNISSATEQMNMNLLSVSDAIVEMSTTIKEVARKAAEASEIAKQANSSSQEIGQNIHILDENVTEVSGMVEKIMEIANQTNLLSLNAAIQAADAGDAGKGFGVVAAEVKELARKTVSFSEEIRQIIARINSSTEKSVDSIQQITGIIGSINESNNAIASAVEEQSITSAEISRNVNQLSVASTEVAKNIAVISSASKSNLDGILGIAGQTKELQAVSDMLMETVNKFKT